MTEITDPVALADQLDAAQRDAEHVFSRITERAGMSVTVRDASEWFTDRFARLLIDVADGRATRCPHLASGPRPAFAALWRADRVVCKACMRQLTDAHDAPCCDRCHTEPEFIAVHTVQIDTLLVFYALCDHCDALDEAETEPHGPAPVG